MYLGSTHTHTRYNFKIDTSTHTKYRILENTHRYPYLVQKNVLGYNTDGVNQLSHMSFKSVLSREIMKYTNMQSKAVF